MTPRSTVPRSGSLLRRIYRERVAALIGAASIVAIISLSAPEEAIAQAGHAAALPAPTVTPAIDGVLALFEHKSVVALGDAHGLAQEEDFYSALVRDPRFAQRVGSVVVEFGGAAAQGIIDRYVGGEKVPFTELRRVWTDTAGAFAPGEPVPMGLVNFFANVRAANLRLPAAQRIKVWLGDPKIDWTGIQSFQDLQPYLRMRDDSEFEILSGKILQEHKKALLIIGLGHLFGPRGLGPLSSKIVATYPDSLAIVAPFIGYVEPQCNAKFLARAKSWSVPSVLTPVAGTWLESELKIPGCNFIPPQRLDLMKKMAAGMPAGARVLGPGGPPKPGSPPGPASVPPGRSAPPSPMDMIAGEINILSGVKADAMLYLGPPAAFSQSPMEPSLYLDPDYFNELDQRARCCVPPGKALDWEQIVGQSSAAPQVYGTEH